MKAGIHLPNDGIMQAEDWELIADLPLVKALVRLDTVGWGEVDWWRLAAHLREDCTVILRLFFPGKLEPGDFLTRSARKLRPILELLGDREILIEIHNEPNHAEGIEGWGAAPMQAKQFATWYAQVYAGLMDAGFHNLGWPGLAVGSWAHNERHWAKLCRHQIRNSSWIGVHAYWQRPEEIDHPDLGGNWRWYRQRWPNKRIIVTEAGNSSCHNPELPQLTPERQRAEYLAWCRAAAAGGVEGVAFYMLGGSEDWAGFRLCPETVQALIELNLY